MGTYGYISIIAMVCYGFMLLMFLTAKRNKIVNSFLVVLVGLLFWAGGSAFILSRIFGASGIWYAFGITEFATAVIAYMTYRRATIKN